MTQRSLITKLMEVIDEDRAERRESAPPSEPKTGWQRRWLPSRGNVLFTLVMIAVLLWAQSAGAVPFRAESAASTGTIAYQGRLADSSGNPLTQTLNMSFRLYSAATGGAALWTEQWTGPNGVQVSDGLFNVMLGSLTPIAQSLITGNSNLFLGITVGTDDEMTPRVQLGSVPFAVQALTVPDGSVTQAKATFAPQVYFNDARAVAGTAESVEKPVIYAGWFHGGEDGIETLDLSHVFTRIDAVSVTKARLSDGNDNQVTFEVTDASGRNRPIPSEVRISAYSVGSGTLTSWIQAYVVIYGR